MADAMSGMDVITCDHDWIELRTGESAIVAGKLSTELAKGERTVMVSQPDWTDIVIEVPLGAEKEATRGARVTIVATRNEDGLETTPAGITIEEDPTK